MALKDLLKEKNYTDEQVKEIIDAINHSPDEYTTKGAFNGKIDEIKKLNDQLADRDKQLEDLKKKAGDNEDLNKKITELQDQNAKAKQEYEKNLVSIRKDIALAAKYGDTVYSIDDIKKNFDYDKLVLNDNGDIIDGFDAQDKALRESKPHYFKPAEGEGSKGTNVDSFLKGLEPGSGAIPGAGSPTGKQKAIEFSKNIVSSFFPQDDKK